MKRYSITVFALLCINHCFGVLSHQGLQNSTTDRWCFMNSAIQALFHTRAFNEFIQQQDAASQSDSVAREYIVLNKTLKTATGTLDPRSLYNLVRQAMGFDHGAVLDVDEFLNYLFNLRAFEATVYKLFGAEITSFIKLLVHESCSEAGLSMEKVTRQPQETRLSLGLRASLGDSLSAYFAPEQLTGDNQVRCDWCGKKFDATKQLKFALLPKVLILQLKRFEFNITDMRNKKIDTSVPLTANLTLDPHWFTSELQTRVNGHDMIYHLFAIIIHRGQADPKPNTKEGAHYWTYAKDYEDPAGQWWRFDDELATGNMNAHVDTIISSGIDSYDRSGWMGVSTPYFLFYELDTASEQALRPLITTSLEKLPGASDYLLTSTCKAKPLEVASNVGFFQNIKNYLHKACNYISMLWR